MVTAALPGRARVASTVRLKKFLITPDDSEAVIMGTTRDSDRPTLFTDTACT